MVGAVVGAVVGALVGAAVGAVVGAVVGATQNAELQRCQALAPSVPLLCPGLGAQGADLATLKTLPTDLQGRMIMPLARGISSAGPVFADLLSEAKSWKAKLEG